LVTNSPQLKCRVNCIYRCSCTSLHGKGIEKGNNNYSTGAKSEHRKHRNKVQAEIIIQACSQINIHGTPKSWPVFHQTIAESLDQRTIILVRFPALSSISSLKPDFEKASIISISVSISTSSIRPACSPQSAILILPVSSET